MKAFVRAGDGRIEILVGGLFGDKVLDARYPVKVGDDFAGTTITPDLIGRSFEILDFPAVIKATARPRATAVWQLIHAVADRMVPRIRRAFLAAVEGAWRANVGTLAAVEEAIRTGSVSAVLQAIGASTIADDLERRLRAGDFAAALTTTYQAAGVEVMPAVLQQLRRQTSVPFELRFDLQHPRAVEFLRAYDGNLIRQLGDDTRRAIIDVTRRAFERGGHPYAQAREIRRVENFGLTARQNAAVANYRQALEDAGTTGDKLERLTERYRQRTLKYRAEMIARTETIRASEAGHQEAWQQAADAGLFDRTTARRHWVVTPDDRLCPECRAIPGLNPGGVAFDADFRTPDGPWHQPPLHPACRCATIMRFPDE